MSSPSYNGYQQPDDGATEFSAHAFVIQSIIGKLATNALVKVLAVTNSGGVSPVGYVDVQPMVHQVDGTGNPTPHATIHNLPYFRLQGGTNAFVVDPVVGDIGVAVFCSRDISQVKRTKKISNPGSAARFDWADGLYIGGFLNGIPTNYVYVSPAGIQVTATNQVTVTAPAITLNGPTTINGATTINGNVATTGTLTNNGHAVGSTHLHTGVTTGSGTSGPPP